MPTFAAQVIAPHNGLTGVARPTVLARPTGLAGRAGPARGRVRPLPVPSWAPRRRAMVTPGRRSRAGSPRGAVTLPQNRRPSVSQAYRPETYLRRPVLSFSRDR